MKELEEADKTAQYFKFQLNKFEAENESKSAISLKENQKLQNERKILIEENQDLKQ